MFPALVAKFGYSGKPEDEDYGLYSHFQTTKIRESRSHKKYVIIPTKYDYESKRLIETK